MIKRSLNYSKFFLNAKSYQVLRKRRFVNTVFEANLIICVDRYKTICTKQGKHEGCDVNFNLKFTAIMAELVKEEWEDMVQSLIRVISDQRDKVDPCFEQFEVKILNLGKFLSIKFILKYPISLVLIQASIILL